METAGLGTGQLNLNIQIGAVWDQTFTFYIESAITGANVIEDISTKTFSFFVKKFKGDRLKIFNLTNGNGITVPVYSLNQIRIIIPASVTSIEEGEYYWELRRTDLDKAKISGLAYFNFDAKE